MLRIPKPPLGSGESLPADPEREGDQRQKTKGKKFFMEWNRSETIALAKHSCTLCHGIGLRPSWGQSLAPCNCVLRAIFRACYVRFCHCADKQQCLTQSSYEYSSGSGEAAVIYDHKHEEYAADFIAIAKRTLDEFEHKLFTYHYLLGADWKLCCARLKMDRGNFFHAVYRVQQKLGRAFRETEPYGLFPVYEYFEESRREAPSSNAQTPAKAGNHLQRKHPQRISPKRTDETVPGIRPSVRGRRIA